MSQTALRNQQATSPAATRPARRRPFVRARATAHAPLASSEAARQRRALQALLRRLAKLPVCQRDAGFAGRDHDKVLYGGA